MIRPRLENGVTRVTVEDAFTHLLHSTQAAGKWTPGDRFWIQVREYKGDRMVLRFFNVETSETFDQTYPWTRPPA